MKLSNPEADLYIPDGASEEDALSRTTHLSIAAHQDDIEIMAYHGIAACFGRPDRWFTGVVVTNGAGSPRSGIYGAFSDEQMRRIRLIEQRKAAFIGEYSAQYQLGYTSAQVKDSRQSRIIEDLLTILQSSRPETVYLHNPADKHDTHIAVMLRALAALRALPPEDRPRQVYGCEVWRNLDWLPDQDKQALPVSSHPNLAASLVGVFDSQITGGKRYDLATAGRRLANASYLESHATDQETALTFAVDLTPLVHDPDVSVLDYTLALVERFREDVRSRLGKFS
jgi:LmbE family N-acetylglucosaminyl deacetylase